MIAHFFDINTLITSKGEVWIVSKLNPIKPLVKITQSEFNLIKKGVFKKYNQSIKIGGSQYWITEDLMNTIKIRCSKEKTDITTLSFSMQEFMNPDLIEKIDYEIWSEHFINLKNSNDDIYIICSKNTKRNYKFLIEKLEEKLKELGLKVKDYYFISETFYNRDEDEITYKKVRLLLQHLIGLKTEVDKFTEEEITKYKSINFYEDEKKSLDVAKKCNDLLSLIYTNSSDELKSKVKDVVNNEKPTLIINQVTYNKVNKIITSEVFLTLDKIIKTFESFNLFYQSLYSTLRS
jgi:hypothetical protein